MAVTMPTRSLLLFRYLLLSLATTCLAFLPPQNPPWPPTYNMTLSTLAMAVNSSGWLDLGFASRWGIISIDWGNADKVWAQQHPMDCEERLLTQAEAIKSRNPATRVFVYRNVVKALNWFSSVRVLLDNPDYAGFFLRFAGTTPGTNRTPPVGPFHVPPCTTQGNVTLCSGLYHDQEETPELVTSSDPSPSIPCYAPCDCGLLPCGEYLFDHRNGSQLTEWLLQEYILGSTALGSPAISGLFIDDFWCSLDMNSTQDCQDPVPGPSEIDANSQVDMGLSNESLLEITEGWLKNMEAIQQAIVDAGGYTWSLMPGQNNANAMPIIVNSTNCLPLLQSASRDSGPYQEAPLLAGLSYNATLGTFPFLQQQLAAFLLMRGPYAYIGWGEWGLMWPPQVPLPPEIWEADPGVPLETGCREVEPGVFERMWSKMNVTLDCSSWMAWMSNKP